MKRTPLKRYTPAKPKSMAHIPKGAIIRKRQDDNQLHNKIAWLRRKPLNGKSPAKIRQLAAEAPIRIALCQRAGGVPVLQNITYMISGIAHTYTKVTCEGGKCECGCGQSVTPETEQLEPHEKHSRGRGGKLSLSNTIMVIRGHHRVLQGNEPIWSKP